MSETGFSPSSLPPYQVRVIDEKNELDVKISALHKFIEESLVFAGLKQDEQGRLRSQRTFMEQYSLILGERIAAFYTHPKE